MSSPPALWGSLHGSGSWLIQVSSHWTTMGSKSSMTGNAYKIDGEELWGGGEDEEVRERQCRFVVTQAH